MFFTFVVVFIVLTFVSPILSLVSCPKGSFTVGSMTDCHPLLTCSDFADNVVLLKLIGFGTVKWVFLAKWRHFDVSVSVLRDESYSADFNEGLNLLKVLSPSQYVNQLVGYCDRGNVIVTEYRRMNNANSLRYLLGDDALSTVLAIELCLNYVEILRFIHNSPVGVRVNCDSNSVEKILSQLLVTDELKLVLNDLDAIPELVSNVTVTCGHPVLSRHSPLVPPELKVSHKGHHMYTDKTDVWKVPDVCDYLFSLADSAALSFAVFNVHSQCKRENPSNRPSSQELLRLYSDAFHNLTLSI